MSYTSREQNIIAAYKEAKEEKIKLQERQKMCLEEMKKEFGVSTAEELKNKIDDTKKRLKKLEDKIEPMLSKLEEALDI